MKRSGEGDRHEGSKRGAEDVTIVGDA